MIYKLLLTMLLVLGLTTPAMAQLFGGDRTEGTVVLDSLDEVSKVQAQGYNSFIVSFTSNASFVGTIKPVCSFTATPVWEESTDFKLIQNSDDATNPGINTTLTDADVVGTFSIFCGGKNPRHVGVIVDAITSGTVTAQTWAVNNVRVVTLMGLKGVDPWGTLGLKTEEQNKAEMAGKSGASSIDSFPHCTGQFNVVLDANETVALTSLPSGGQFSRICWAIAVMDGAATGAANVSLVNGTTTTTPCDTSQDTNWGPVTLDNTKTYGVPIGKPNGPWLATQAAELICGKSTNATATNKIILYGTYATY